VVNVCTSVSVVLQGIAQVHVSVVKVLVVKVITLVVVLRSVRAVEVVNEVVTLVVVEAHVLDSVGVVVAKVVVSEEVVAVP